MKYQQKTYGKGFALKVTPEDRSVDLMHYLTVGSLLGGRSLEGVTWEKVDINKTSASRLADAMRVNND